MLGAVCARHSSDIPFGAGTRATHSLEAVNKHFRQASVRKRSSQKVVQRGGARVVTRGPRGTRGAHTPDAHLVRRVASLLIAIATPSQFMRECLEAFSRAIRRHASTCPIRMALPGPFLSTFLAAIVLMLCLTPAALAECRAPLVCSTLAPRDMASCETHRRRRLPIRIPIPSIQTRTWTGATMPPRATIHEARTAQRWIYEEKQA